MRSFFRILFLTALLLPFGAQAKELEVVASFSILADMTRQITGNDAHVTSLVEAQSDAHAFSPSPADVRKVAHADIVIINGLGFEGWSTRLLQASGFKGQLVTASDGVTPILINTIPDPHAWQNIANAETYVANIRDALVKADPAHADDFKHNAERYLKKLAETDVWSKAQLASVPKERRRAAITHDAMRYFAAAYGVDFTAPLGLSTDSDISAADMRKLVDAMRARNLRVVFLENMADPRLMRQLVADGGASIGGTLYSDALSGAQGPAPDYIALMRYNVSTVAQALLKP